MRRLVLLPRLLALFLVQFLVQFLIPFQDLRRGHSSEITSIVGMAR